GRVPTTTGWPAIHSAAGRCPPARPRTHGDRRVCQPAAGTSGRSDSDRLRRRRRAIDRAVSTTASAPRKTTAIHTRTAWLSYADAQLELSGIGWRAWFATMLAAAATSRPTATREVTARTWGITRATATATPAATPISGAEIAAATPPVTTA